jgi:hypothetical protein
MLTNRNIFDNYEISRCNIGVGDFSLLGYIVYSALHYPEYGKSEISRNVGIHNQSAWLQVSEYLSLFVLKMLQVSVT